VTKELCCDTAILPCPCVCAAVRRFATSTSTRDPEGCAAGPSQFSHLTTNLNARPWLKKIVHPRSWDWDPKPLEVPQESALGDQQCPRTRAWLPDGMERRPKVIAWPQGGPRPYKALLAAPWPPKPPPSTIDDLLLPARIPNCCRAHRKVRLHYLQPGRLSRRARG